MYTYLMYINIFRFFLYLYIYYIGEYFEKKNYGFLKKNTARVLKVNLIS